MLSDEENNVIDLLKNNDKQKCLMLNCPVVKNNIERQLKIIELNRTIRKQQKEIERLEARKYMLNAETGEITQIPIDNNYISKDKIKAKIEELKDECKYCNFTGEVCQELLQNNNCTQGNTLKVLQSLLEKE